GGDADAVDTEAVLDVEDLPLGVGVPLQVAVHDRIGQAGDFEQLFVVGEGENLGLPLLGQLGLLDGPILSPVVGVEKLVHPRAEVDAPASLHWLKVENSAVVILPRTAAECRYLGIGIQMGT